jgi:hypothetical protein
MAELQPPNNNLQDFWKTLWHIDVKKDHPSEYDQDIVNRFLPNSMYVSTFGCNNNIISQAGIQSGLNPARIRGGILNKEDIFNCLIEGGPRTYSDLYDIAQGHLQMTQPEIYNLNPTLVGQNVSYVVSSFTLDGNGLNNFIEHPTSLFVDVALNIKDLISTYNNQASAEKPLVYAYTREIQNDPAFKITYETIAGKSVEEKRRLLGNKNNFYYEKLPPANGEKVVYPAFNNNNPMSYFYCKYPVFLKYNHLHKHNYTLDVTLSVQTQNGLIVIPEGANEAGAINKSKVGQLAVWNKYPDSIRKELVFISKHHGDVAQSLVINRKILLENPGQPPKQLNSQNFQSAFVSFDLNAITKALTFGVPYIFMYAIKQKESAKRQRITRGGVKRGRENSNEEDDYSDKKVLVWKKIQTGVTVPEIAQIEPVSPLEQTNNTIRSYNELIEKLRTHIPNYIQLIKNKIQEYINTTDSPIIKYRNILRLGINLAVFFSQLSNNILPEITDELSYHQIIVKQKEMETVYNLTNRLINKMIVYDRRGNFKGYRLIFISLEKEILIDLEKYVSGIIEPIFPAKNSIESIDLEYTWGLESYGRVSPRGCRITTKLNSSWGMDILKKVHTDIKRFDEQFSEQLENQRIASLIVNKLREVISNDPNKVNTFNNGIAFIGINEQIMEGGARLLPRLRERIQSPLQKQREKRFNNITRKNRQLLTTNISKEDLTQYNGMLMELNDIDAHCQYILESIILYGYMNKLSKENYQKIGKMSLSKFMNKVYGQSTKQVGGDSTAEIISQIQSMISTMDTQASTVGREEISLFDEPDTEMIEAEVEEDEESQFNIYSTYSVLFQYQELVNLLSEQESITRVLNFIQRIPRGEAARGRVRHYAEIENKLKEIKSKLNQIQDVYTKQEEELEAGVSSIIQTAGKRYRKYKTIKKSKKSKNKVKRKTSKRLK